MKDLSVKAGAGVVAVGALVGSYVLGSHSAPAKSAATPTPVVVQSPSVSPTPSVSVSPTPSTRALVTPAESPTPVIRYKGQ